MMITKHGFWRVYDTIDSTLVGLPPNVLVLFRDGDNAEWYEYQTTFNPDTIKATIYDGHVLMARVDVSMIYPAGCSLIEIDDTTGDPASYIGKQYDEETNSFVG